MPYKDKEVARAKERDRYYAKFEQDRPRRQAYYVANRAKIRRTLKNCALQRRYGIDLRIFEAMLEQQKRLCAICNLWMKVPCVDHCHVTLKVRGLLCQGCNGRLFALEDQEWRRAAIRYLRR